MNITSLQNEHVKYWVHLQDKKFRDEEKVFLIEGDHLITEARNAGLKLQTIGLDASDDFIVTKEILKKISTQKSGCNKAAVVSFLPEKTLTGNILVLDNIQDPGNLGTIIRSAVAFNMPNIILSDDSADLYNPKVIRSTEGMIFKVNVKRQNLQDVLPKLKDDGYKIIGTNVDSGENIQKYKKEKIALVIGNEGIGLKESTKSFCDEFVNIKMNENCESLNAGVAASILMYEVNK